MKGRKSKSNQRRTKFRSFVACLTAVSVLMGSTYFVMADAPDPVYICGMEEHEHTGEKGSCYETQLVCGMEEEVVYDCPKGGPHEHGDSCYEYGEPYLDCGVEVEGHMHDDGCYKEVADHDNLLCTEAEHEHGADCSDEEGNVICEDAEHSHSNSCYGTKEVLKCDNEENHFHSDSCYTRDKDLICELKEHECTHEDCYVPAYEGAHKHSKKCEGRVFVCEEEEHEHVDECIQPEEVTEFLEKVDALNETALLLQEAKEVYDEKEAEVAEIEARGNAAVEAGEPQEVIDAISAEYAEAWAELEEAQNVKRDVEELFNSEWGFIRLEYSNLGGEEHPEYKDMIPEKQLNLIENGVPYDAEEPVEEVAMFAAPRVSLGTVTTTPAPNVNIKMFNYGQDINSKITNNNGLKFYNFNADRNSVDKSGVTGCVKQYSVPDDMIYDDNGKGWPEADGQTMKKLFDGTWATPITMTNGGGLFTLKNGYYEFDSKYQAAVIDGDSFTVYDAGVVPNGAGSGDNTQGHFMPYNKLFDNSGKALIEDANRTYTDVVTEKTVKLYNQTGLNDMWFGMMMDFQFIMPENGQVNGQDMVFEFAGDDDVLVYVDGKLAIDLSGTHKEEFGTINFRTGEVKLNKRTGAEGDARLGGLTGFKTDRYLYPVNGVTQETGKTVLWNEKFGDYSPHTLQFFYLERGGGCSNCKIKFNLPAIPENSLTVEKNVTTKEGVTLPDNFVRDALTYKFRLVETENETTDGVTVAVPTNTPFMPNKGFTILDAATDNVIDDDATVDSNGYFYLKHGQKAVFENINNSTGSAQDAAVDFMVQEFLPELFDKAYDGVVLQGTAQGTITGDDELESGFVGYYTPVMSSAGTHYVRYNNQVDVSVLGTLEITKTVKGTVEGPFEIEVTLGEGANAVKLPKGTPYSVGGKNKVVDKPGIIELAAGETAVIGNILGGTPYSITERGASTDLDGFTATYTGATGKVPVATIEAVEGGLAANITPAVVAITNTANSFDVEIPLSKTVKNLIADKKYKEKFKFVAELDSYTAPETDNGDEESTPTEQVAEFFAEVVQYFTGPEGAPAKKETIVTVVKEKTEVATSKTENGNLVLTFSKDAPAGTYVYEVTEDLGWTANDNNPNEYKENVQSFFVTIVITENEDPEAMVTSVTMKDAAATDENETVNVLAFVNERIPKKVPVAVQKYWAGNDGKYPTSVQVQLMVGGNPAKDASGNVVSPVTLSADNKWTHRWEGIVNDSDTWAVKEVEVPKYYKVSYSDPSMDKATNVETIKVTNTYIPQTPPGGGPGGGDDYGTLTITKQVVKNDNDVSFSTEIFRMDVLLDDEKIAKGTPYTVNGVAVKDGVAEAGIVPLKDGETAEFTLRAGTKYHVIEEMSGGYFATYTDEKGEIKTDVPSAVKVVNKASEFSLPVAVSKTLIGNVEPGTYEFTFKVECKETNYSNNFTIKVPVAKGEVDANNGKTVTDMIYLPFHEFIKDGTYDYKITEVQKNGFRADEPVRIVKVEVDQDAPVRAKLISVDDNANISTAAFTNRAVYNTLTIEKAAKADSKFDAEQVFKMKVTLDGTEVAVGTPYTVNGVAVEGGVAEAGIVPLKVGDKAVFEVPVDTQYSVAEVDGEGYFATYKVDGNPVEGVAKGEVKTGNGANVLITNQKDDFGVTLNLEKTAYGLKANKRYNFFFKASGNGFEIKPVAITLKDAKEDTDELVTGNGAFELNFNGVKPGTYKFVVKEDFATVQEKYPNAFVENTQEYIVAVKVDPNADYRAQILSVVRREAGKADQATIFASGKTDATLAFFNTTVPKDTVTVTKEWANVTDATRPASVTIELTTTLHGVTETKEYVLSDGNWSVTVPVDEGTSWSVKEVGVAGHKAADEGATKWTAEGTTAYFTTKIEQRDNQAVITNERVVPGGGGGGHDPKDPPVNPPKEEPPTPNNPTPEDPGDVLGENEELMDIGEDGTPLGDKDLEDPMVAGDEEEVSLIAATGDNKIIVVAAAGMVAAIAGILALRKKKED